MAENTQTTDTVLDIPHDVQDAVREILAAAFGPTVAAEVVKEEEEGAKVDATTVADAPVASSDLPGWWKFNLDGTPRKTCQAPDKTKGVAFGETKRHETDLAVLKALHAGAESLVEVVAATGYVKVTCVRSLERLVETGRVVQAKAAPTGKRGRPAFVYRPTTEEAVVPDTAPVDAGASSVQGIEE
jgi:hypothetical protein